VTVARWQGAALGLTLLASGLAPANGQGLTPPQENMSAYELADALLADGRADASCRLLVAVYGAGTSDIGALIRLADCAFAQGDAEQSLAYLRRASVGDRGNAALREQVMILEMAAVLADLAMVAQLEEQPAPTVVAVVPAAQSQPAAVIVHDAAEPDLPGPQWSGRATLQRSYNSNVNGGTYNSTFMAVGLPLAVAPTSRERADWMTRLGVDGRLLVPLDWRNALQVDAGVSGTIYDTETSLARLDLNLAGTWITGTNETGARVRPHADLSWVDGLYDRLTLGVEAGGHHRIAANTMLVGSVDVTHRWDANAAEAGWVVNGSTGVRQFLTPDLTLGANVVLERVAAQAASRAYWRVGPEIYVDAALTDRLGLNLNAGVDFVGFDGSVALFATPREDVRYRAGASLTWALPELAEGLSVQASYRFSHQQSNQDIYDANTHLASVTLAYSF